MGEKAERLRKRAKLNLQAQEDRAAALTKALMDAGEKTNETDVLVVVTAFFDLFAGAIQQLSVGAPQALAGRIDKVMSELAECLGEARALVAVQDAKETEPSLVVQ